MKLLGIELRNAYAAVEFGLAELRNMERFFEKGLPVFIKVYGGTEDELVDEIQQLNMKLKKIIERAEEIKKNGP